MLLEIKNLSKIYKSESGEIKYALNNVSLSFDNAGLVCVVGKSGSGKSTLLNMIGNFDKPTYGKVLFNNQDITKYKTKKKEQYHKNHISIIFQHYHLLENESVLYNVMLPSLINGASKTKSKNKAISLLKEIGLKEGLYQKKCFNLSGGEKERVAVLRAFINDPEIIIADEPTGALDSKNSLLVMDLLKEKSKTKLVIVVTHNLELAKKYADRVVTIDEGKVEKDETITKEHEEINITKNRYHHTDKWINQIVKSNFIKRLRRNIIVGISIIIGLVSSVLIIGFSNGAIPSIENEIIKQFDYGVSTVSKETSYSIEGSPMSIVKMTRPSKEEVKHLEKENNDFIFLPNFDGLIPSSLEIKSGEERIDELSYYPIYSFTDNSLNKDLLMKGRIPINDSLFEVVINDSAYNLLSKKFNFDPLNSFLSISNVCEVSYFTGEIDKPYIIDYFTYQKTIKIVGVVDELDFLSTPKIYYSYVSLIDLLQNTILNNLSAYKEDYISWYDYIVTSNDNDVMSYYSYRVFLSNYNNYEKVKELEEKISPDFTLTNSALTIGGALLDLVNAASIGMEIFLVIALLGTALILGIVSFSSYSEDRKNIAILTCLGANKDDITNIYVFENILLGVISLIFSLLFSVFIKIPINKLLYKFTGFFNMIDIPFSSFMGMRFLLPTIISLTTLTIVIISTYIPLLFSKKISLKEELSDND